MKYFDIRFFLVLFFLLGHTAFAGYERFDQPMRPSPNSQQTIPEIQVIVAPGASNTTGVLAATNNSSTSATSTVTSGISNPDVPRNLRVTTGGTTADCAAGNVVIVGKDALGRSITDSIPVTASQSPSKDAVGTKAFKTVSSITLPAEQSTHGCTYSVGQGNSLGMNRCLDFKDRFFHAGLNGVKEVTAPTLYTSASAVSGNMAALSSAYNSTNVTLVFSQNYRCLP